MTSSVIDVREYDEDLAGQAFVQYKSFQEEFLTFRFVKAATIFLGGINKPSANYFCDYVLGCRGDSPYGSVASRAAFSQYIEGDNENAEKIARFIEMLVDSEGIVFPETTQFCDLLVQSLRENSNAFATLAAGSLILDYMPTKREVGWALYALSSESACTPMQHLRVGGEYVMRGKAENGISHLMTAWLQTKEAAGDCEEACAIAVNAAAFLVSLHTCNIERVPALQQVAEMLSEQSERLESDDDPLNSEFSNEIINSLCGAESLISLADHDLIGIRDALRVEVVHHRRGPLAPFLLVPPDVDEGEFGWLLPRKNLIWVYLTKWLAEFEFEKVARLICAGARYYEDEFIDALSYEALANHREEHFSYLFSGLGREVFDLKRPIIKRNIAVYFSRISSEKESGVQEAAAQGMARFCEIVEEWIATIDSYHDHIDGRIGLFIVDFMPLVADCGWKLVERSDPNIREGSLQYLMHGKWPEAADIYREQYLTWKNRTKKGESHGLNDALVGLLTMDLFGLVDAPDRDDLFAALRLRGKGDFAEGPVLGEAGEILCSDRADEEKRAEVAAIFLNEYIPTCVPPTNTVLRDAITNYLQEALIDRKSLAELWREVKGRSLAENLEGLTGVAIHDSWTGYSVLSPIKATYEIGSVTGVGLSGNAMFSVGGMSSSVGHIETQTAETEVNLPRDAIAEALALLDEAALESTEYHPNFEHTDDYPSIRIEFQFGSDVLALSSRSQGEKRIPWAVTVGDREWVSKGGEIPAVMVLLDAHMQRDVKKLLIERARRLASEDD